MGMTITHWDISVQMNISGIFQTPNGPGLQAVPQAFLLMVGRSMLLGQGDIVAPHPISMDPRNDREVVKNIQACVQSLREERAKQAQTVNGNV